MIKKIKTAIKEAWCDVFGYVVYNSEYQKAHYCMTEKEALEWMKCYNGNCSVFENGRITRFVREVA